MHIRNKSFLDNILESDWKYASKAALLIFIIAYIVLPIVLPTVFPIAFTKAMLSILQIFAKFICIILAFISVLKLFFGSNKGAEHNNLEWIEPSFSATGTNKRSSSGSQTTNCRNNRSLMNEEVKPDLLVGDLTIEVAKSRFNVNEQWTLDFINSLDWKVFESLCSKYFNAIGINNQETSMGADGGIDLVLYEHDEENPSAIVQCKKWSNQIGVKLLREFSGVMHHEKVSKGYYFTTSTFNRAAIEFASGNSIELVDGLSLINLLKRLETGKQKKIFELITSGDYTTPTCVRCGKKMFLRTNTKTQKQFWGCNTYRCGSTLNIKEKPQLQKSKKSNNSLLY